MNVNVQDLINELTEAAELYYQGDTAIMTDEEYDSKCEYLEDLINAGELELTEELDKLLYKSVAAGSVPTGTVIEHDVPMLSLNKAKNSDELLSYHNRLINAGATGFTLQAKLDGLAMSAKYENGKLKQLATRGDGVKGELLNHLINNDRVSIKGLPKNAEGDFELRGELYITDEQFEKINKARLAAVGEEFSNSRNAATGIVKGSIKGIEYDAELTFTTYSMYKKGKQVELEKNIENIEHITQAEIARLTENKILKVGVKFEDLEKAIEQFGILRRQFTIPTDGVVIKPVNEIEMLNKLGFTSRHPVANIAYKYPGTKATTVVKDIIVSVGKTGRLTPQAIVEPVEVDGVVISNITCHNYSWLNKMGIRIGSTVAVTRANDVIPAIDVVIDKGPNSPVEVPKNCPECNESLLSDGTDWPKRLTCTNLECPSRFLFHMKSVAGRNYLHLENLGGVALEALINENVIKTIVDIFRLDEEKLAKVPVGITSTGNIRYLGKGNAKNIMKSIERAKESTDSNKLLASLNIEGMGPNTAKRLITHFGGIIEVLSVKPSRLTEVDQVGQSLVKSFEIHGERALRQLNELIELGVKINDPQKKDIKKQGTFSVSGSVDGFANRNEFVEYMEGLGWEFHRTPKKDTDILFADPNGTSSKIKKAKANGTRIIKNIKDM
jgi:DNA ligase (NAD+)